METTAPEIEFILQRTNKSNFTSRDFEGIEGKEPVLNEAVI